jgi:hypothetical protein
MEFLVVLTSVLIISVLVAFVVGAVVYAAIGELAYRIAVRRRR